MTTAICAICGERKELCDSIRIDGIKQPRFCKSCLLNLMQTGNYETNDIYWLLQLTELKDEESLNKIKERIDEEP